MTDYVISKEISNKIIIRISSYARILEMGILLWKHWINEKKKRKKIKFYYSIFIYSIFLNISFFLYKNGRWETILWSLNKIFFILFSYITNFLQKLGAPAISIIKIIRIKKKIKLKEGKEMYDGAMTCGPEMQWGGPIRSSDGLDEYCSPEIIKEEL